MIARTTRKKITSETVKEELLNSLQENNNLEHSDIDATVDTVTDPLKAIGINITLQRNY